MDDWASRKRAGDGHAKGCGGPYGGQTRLLGGRIAADRRSFEGRPKAGEYAAKFNFVSWGPHDDREGDQARG